MLTSLKVDPITYDRVLDTMSADVSNMVWAKVYYPAMRQIWNQIVIPFRQGLADDIGVWIDTFPPVV